MGDRLRIPMNVFLFFLSAQSLFLSLSLPVFIQFFPPLIFLSLSLPPHAPVLSFRCSYFLSLLESLSLAAFVVWIEGLSAAAGLSCAVICHTTEGKKHLLLMLPPFLSLVVLQLPFIVAKNPHLARSFQFPRMSGRYLTWGCNFSVNPVAGWLVVTTFMGSYLTLTSCVAVLLSSRTWHWHIGCFVW